MALDHCLLAEESPRAAGLYKVGRDIAELAKRGEWVWEVRIKHRFEGTVDGRVMVNANTGQIRSLGGAEIAPFPDRSDDDGR
jgi:hypothetical protein